MSKVLKRHYVEVSANSSSTLDYTPANGVIIQVLKLGCNSGSSPDTIVYIVWDEGGAEEEVLVATHGDTIQDVQFEFTGNGARKLTIKCVNDQTQPDYLGGFWEGALV